MPQASLPPVRALADLVGIVPSYVDQTGRETRVTTDETRVAILAAMGIDASTERRAMAALRRLRAAKRQEMLAPSRVVSVEEAGLPVPLSLAAGAGTAQWVAEVVEEQSGAVHRREGRFAAGEPVSVTMPAGLPIGYHQLRVRVTRGQRELSADQRLIVVPPRCTPPDEMLGGRRAFGVVANLYTLHSERNWGVGDFTDLATLAAWAGDVGADFVGVNPLHALLCRGTDISPYSPVSRLFRNIAYVDVEAVPELRQAPYVAERIASPPFQAELAVLRENRRVEYEKALYLKLAALEELYAVFRDRVLPEGGARAEAYREWARREEPELTAHATWMALARREGREARYASADWHEWPTELQRPDSEAVREFQRAHADAIELERWLQFEADRQLGAAAERARSAGLAVGLYQDLAIGTSPNGSDAWAFGDLFVRGASIGAPPDPLGPAGQNWGLPPIDPRRLRADGYRYYVKLLRAAFRHSGALRIDHVMGLFRLFWIPAGMSGVDGAYVRMPSEDLFGILALESVRHGAVVVGEDLGTVPPEVPPALARWGVLSSKVMFFERDKRGGFKPPEEYAELALATANTHDMATLAGFWSGRDITLRAEVGETPDEAVGPALRDREREKAALMLALAKEGSVDTNGTALGGAELVGAVHEFLCRTPSVLVGLSLDDLTGEEKPVNLPGVGPEAYPSWTRKMRCALEELPTDPYVKTALRCGRGMERGRK